MTLKNYYNRFNPAKRYERSLFHTRTVHFSFFKSFQQSDHGKLSSSPTSLFFIAWAELEHGNDSTFFFFYKFPAVRTGERFNFFYKCPFKLEHGNETDWGTSLPVATADRVRPFENTLPFLRGGG